MQASHLGKQETSKDYINREKQQQAHLQTLSKQVIRAASVSA